MADPKVAKRSQRRAQLEKRKAAIKKRRPDATPDAIGIEVNTPDRCGSTCSVCWKPRFNRAAFKRNTAMEIKWETA